MKKIGNSLLLLVITFVASIVWGQASVTLEVDRETVAPGESITLSVIVTADSDITGEPRIPDFGGFTLKNVWSHSSSSSRMAIVNGKPQFTTKKQNVFNYLLQAEKIGEFTIGPFVVNADGKKIESETIRLKIANGASSPGGRTRPGRPIPPGGGGPAFDDEESIDPFSAQDDMFEQLLKQREKLLQQFNQQFGAPGGQFPPNSQNQQPQQKQMDVNTKEAFFIYAEVDKSEVYAGEQVTVSWYVYTRGQMETLDRLKFPTLKGFWKEIIEEVPALRFEDEIVNGVAYKKALLASHALFPIKPGSAVVDEFKVRSKVRIIENFGLGPAYTYTKSSKPVTIKVKPLPEEGKPKDFSGAVGDFSVRSFVDNPQAQLNQPFSLKVRFEGEGNAKLIELPSLNLPPDLEIYDTKNDSKFFKNGTSYKEFDVVVVPRHKGTVNIPSFHFSFFNAKTGKYQSAQTEPLEIFVGDPVAGAPTSNNESSTKKVQKPVTLSAQPVIEMSRVQLYGRLQDRLMIYLSVLALIVLGFIAQIYVQFFRPLKNSRLIDHVQPKIKKVEALIHDKNIRQASAEMINIFNFVFSKISRSDEMNLEFKQMVENTPVQLRKEFEGQILSQFNEFQMYAFAPEEMTQQFLSQPENEKKLIQKVQEAQTLLQKVVKSYDQLNEN